MTFLRVPWMAAGDQWFDRRCTQACPEAWAQGRRVSVARGGAGGIVLPLAQGSCELLQVGAVDEGSTPDPHDRYLPPADQLVHLRPSDPKQDGGCLDPKQQPSLC